MEPNRFQAQYRHAELILYRVARCDHGVAGAECREDLEEPRQEMLILQRKPRESFYIGDDVQVIVLGVRGNQIRIGIKAPKNLRVDREEIRKRIEQELADPDGNTMDPIDDEAITSS